MAYASASVSGNELVALPAGEVPLELPEREAGVSSRTIAIIPRYPIISSTAHKTARSAQTYQRPPPPVQVRRGRRPGRPGCPPSTSGTSPYRSDRAGSSTPEPRTITPPPTARWAVLPGHTDHPGDPNAHWAL